MVNMLRQVLCPSAQRQWRKLFSLWRCLGTFDKTDKYLWVLGMELPGIPRATWDVIMDILGPPGDLFRARSAVFPAACELCRCNNASCHLDRAAPSDRGLNTTERSTHRQGTDSSSTCANILPQLNLPTWRRRGRPTPGTVAVSFCRHSTPL